MGSVVNKENVTFFKKNKLVSNWGNVFFIKKINNKALFKEVKLFSSFKKILKEILNLKNWNLYCSLDQFLCAMGALVKVNFFLNKGATKIFILFLVFVLCFKKFK